MASVAAKKRKTKVEPVQIESGNKKRGNYNLFMIGKRPQSLINTEYDEK